MAAIRRTAAARAVLVAAFVLALLPLLGRAALVESTSWIDAPLDGAVLPLAPYEVVAHSADQGGIAEVVLEVDGTQVASRTGSGAPRLMTSRIRWLPPGEGTYVLTISARNRAGEWGAPASSTVVITNEVPPPTAEPGATPDASPDGSSSPGPTVAPGQTPGPTPTKAPTPAPTPVPCTVPVATLIVPIDFIKLYPPDTNPEFLWEYTGDEDCIASQTLVILVPPSVGEDEEIPLGAGVRSYQRRDAFEPDLTDLQLCGHYHWYIVTVDAEGTGEQSAPGSFDICAPNPDG